MTVFRVSSTALLLSLASLSPVAAQQPDSTRPSTRLEITPARRQLAVGDSLQLSARALDSAGRPIPDATIFFHQAGLAAAQVDSTGLVRAGGVGDVLVVTTALVPGAKPVVQRVVLEVGPGPAKRIEIASHPERLVPGQRVPLAARVYSAEGDVRPDDSVHWTSSAPGTARVTRGGLLEARGPGRATLTATAGGVRATTAVAVTAAAPASLAIEPGDARVKQGDVVRFRLVAKDAAGGPSRA